jgi:hypothetical protein
MLNDSPENRPDACVKFIGDPLDYYRLDDCLGTQESAVEYLTFLGFSVSEAERYLGMLPYDYE